MSTSQKERRKERKTKKNKTKQNKIIFEKTILLNREACMSLCEDNNNNNNNYNNTDIDIALCGNVRPFLYRVCIYCMYYLILICY